MAVDTKVIVNFEETYSIKTHFVSFEFLKPPQIKSTIRAPIPKETYDGGSKIFRPDQLLR